MDRSNISFPLQDQNKYTFTQIPNWCSPEENHLIEISKQIPCILERELENIKDTKSLESFLLQFLEQTIPLEDNTSAQQWWPQRSSRVTIYPILPLTTEGNWPLNFKILIWLGYFDPIFIFVAHSDTNNLKNLCCKNLFSDIRLRHQMGSSDIPSSLKDDLKNYLFPMYSKHTHQFWDLQDELAYYENLLPSAKD